MLLLAIASCLTAVLAAMETTIDPSSDLTEFADTSDARSTTTALDSKATAMRNVDGRFCSQTVSYTLETDCKPCWMNIALSCPTGLVQLTQVLSQTYCMPTAMHRYDNNLVTSHSMSTDRLRPILLVCYLRIYRKNQAITDCSK